ncbi:MAG: hypothetical protein ACR2G0_11235 [Chthoniobacterales bacterium]
MKLLPLILCVLLCSLAHASPFGSWAARGVVERKDFRPTPLSGSLGLEGIYRLELRGADHKLRRQMVTREVFFAYEIGDHFSELDQARTTKKREPVKLAEEPVAPAAGPETPVEEEVNSVKLPRDMSRETEGF